MFKLVVALIVMLPFQASADQTCTIKYVGRDSDHAAEGEPSVDVTGEGYLFKRVNESYGNPNTFRWLLPMANLIPGKPTLPVDVFEVTCVDE